MSEAGPLEFIRACANPRNVPLKLQPSIRREVRRRLYRLKSYPPDSENLSCEQLLQFYMVVMKLKGITPSI